MGVEVLGAGYDLEHDGFDLGGEEGFGHVFEQGLEVVFEEVHDEVDAVRPNGWEKWLMRSGIGAFQGEMVWLPDLLLERRAHDDFSQVDNVRMS